MSFTSTESSTIWIPAHSNNPTRTSSNATRKVQSYLSFIRIVLKLCDELDKAKDLHDYYIKTLTNYITQKIKPVLNSLHNENLLQAFVKWWSNYTLLVHFTTKMLHYLVSIFLSKLTCAGSVLPQEYEFDISCTNGNQSIQG